MRWICRLDRVRLAKGDRLILDDVSLTVLPGSKIGVVGPNGAGKSTTLRVLAGQEPPSNGTASVAEGASVGILHQDPALDDTATVLQNVQAGVRQTIELIARFNQAAAQLGEDPSEAELQRFGQLQDELDRLHAWDVDSRLDQAMGALRCPPGDAPVASLSGGERRRVALCALLVEQPDLLLLDEPTNHLDTESVQWLEEHLADYPGTVVAVTHDRYFLDNVAQWILELDRGRAYPYQGNYSTYLQTKHDRLVIEGRKDAALRRRLDTELQWVHADARGRQIQSRSRLARYEELAAAAEHAEMLDFDEIQIPPGPRLGSQVVEAHDLVKARAGSLLFDGLSFSLPRNGIVGVLGPNGVGKTTLFEMIVGAEPPDAGAIVVGESVRLSYVDQTRQGMEADKTAWEIVSGGESNLTVGHVEIPSRAYLAAFGFKGPDQQKLARLLSGGERGRLNLALTLRQGGNVLLLDEPTNDLDTETLGSLEAALLRFPGCAVVTAHDRWFLDRVATHILAWEGSDADPGRWFWFEGNFAAYQRSRVDRFGLEAAQPRRTAHRRLARR